MADKQSRREFLADSLALATATGSSSLPDAGQISRRGPVKRVIVIGAGLAGLAASHELKQAGHDVVVLEARARPGGRVLTLREPFSDGLYAEAGALFIPSNHRHTVRYARQFNLTLEPIFPRGAAETYYVRNKRIIARRGAAVSWPFNLKPDEQALGYGGMWDRYINDAAFSLPDPEAPGWPSDELKPLDQLSLADFLRRRGASEEAISLLRVGYLDLWGDGVESYSALSILRDLALRKGENTTFAIRGGNDQLPKAFAEGLKGQIRFGAAVGRIERMIDRVRVHYRQGPENRLVEGDRVVCSVPFSVLRRIEVSPPFTASKQAAIDQLSYTSVTRVYLQSRTRFWKEQGIPGNANTDLPIMWLWEPTINQSGPRGILESYSAGPRARAMAGMREADRVAFTLEHMERVYPGMRAQFELGASKCWDDDEWSRGDYAWFKPGQMTALIPVIASSEGRIHFAGEHASSWPGWMQGALDSGLRAAREVNESE